MNDPIASREVLVHLLQAYSPMALAFSGGLDSRFVAFTAKQLHEQGVKVHLYFFRGPHMSPEELREAEAWARQQQLPLTVLELDPLDVPELRCNDQERCYHCKLHMFRSLYHFVTKNSPFPGEHVSFCDGSNASDRSGFRPGLRALKELSIHSPLAEAGLTKEDIQKLAAFAGLDKPFQRARPCLITRFAYGLEPDARTLAALAQAELAIVDLLEAAVRDGKIAPPAPDFRVRLLDGPGPDKGAQEKCSGSAKERALSDFTVELQVEAVFLPAGLADLLSAAVMEQRFAKTGIELLDKVAGSYDRLEGLGLTPSRANRSKNQAATPRPARRSTRQR